MGHQGRVRSWLATIHKSIGGQGGMILEPWLHHFGIGGSTPSTPTIGQADNTNNVRWLDALSSQAGPCYTKRMPICGDNSFHRN